MKKLAVLTVLLFAGFVLAPRAQAAPALTYSWSGVTGNWTTSGDWTTTGSNPPVSSVENSLIFANGSSAYSTTNGVQNLFQLNQLLFNETGSDAGAITLTGDTLDFVQDSEGDLPKISDTSAGNVTISVSFTTATNTTISNTGGATLTLGGTLTNNGGVTFSGNSSSPIVISSSPLIASGSTGNITLNSGVLLTENNNIFGTASVSYTLYLDGGEIGTTAATGSAKQLPNPVVFNGSVQLGDSTNYGVVFDPTGGITIDDGSVITAASTEAFDGLSSASTTNILESGPTGITIAAKPGITLTFNGGFTGQAGNGSTGGLTFDGGGNIVLTGGAASGGSNYTGPTTVSGTGTVVTLSGSASHLAIPTGQSLTINGAEVSQSVSTKIGTNDSVTIEGGGTYALSGLTAATTLNTIGSLTIGDTNTDPGNTLSFALPATGSGTNTAFLKVTNALTINTNSVIDLSFSGGTTNDSYALLTIGSGSIDVGSGAGDFTSITPDYVLTTNVNGTSLYVEYEIPSSSPALAYWTGSSNSSWQTYQNFSTTNTTNTPATAVPGSTTDVVFSTSSPTATNLSTTLDAPTTVNSLTFNSTSGAVTIAAGTNSGSLTLEATTTTSSNGINVAPNGINDQSGAGAVTISAPVALGTNQTWTNASSNALTISGVVSGGYALTTAGSGTIALST
ncbi:MAG: hypothetical protein LV481_00880, partial [Methylacidiphilales bacterium]|nr:hypothetical protein [Candidatus Methylacidiphilales bacterium]